jgi:hydroxymethylbilane synthase
MQRMCRNQLRQLRSLMAPSLRIGTRGSQLALWQANWVKDALVQHHPSLEVELVIIKTQGDRIQDVPLAKIGSSALFVKEIEASLLEGTVDVAVHSMKDMPSLLGEGLAIAAVPVREHPSDVLISKNAKGFFDLPPGARIGTSSLRRGAQLMHARKDIALVSLRGNLGTRIRKLGTENLDAIVLAAAGVRRLNLADRITEYLAPELVLPAVGQGALCIEVRGNDEASRRIVSVLDDPVTRQVVTAERAFLGQLGGTCQVPLAAHGRIEGDTLTLEGLVASLDGGKMLRDRASGPVEGAQEIGTRLAGRLAGLGALDILEDILSPDQFEAVRMRIGTRNDG